MMRFDGKITVLVPVVMSWKAAESCAGPDPVQAGVEQPEPPSGVLVGEGSQSSPERCGRARPAAGTGPGGAFALGDERQCAGAISVDSDVGNTSLT